MSRVYLSSSATGENDTNTVYVFFAVQAPAWLKLNIALFTAGGIGVFSLFDQNKDPEAY